MQYAEDIKTKRQALGLTQKEFSDALGFGRYGERKIRRWENGENSPSNLEYQSIIDFAKEIPFTPNKNPSFSFIDLFAGIGGIRIPFQKLNGQCVFTSEWDKYAQKTYRLNFGEDPHGDLTKISSDDIPNFDILLAGFPCQPFSQAGLKKGFDDTRGTLFFEIERIITDKRPKAFMLENVKQLRGHDGGKTLATIIKHLEALNYDVKSDVLRAADFGVPQNRERLFIVGFNKNEFEKKFYHTFKFPDKISTPTYVGQILEDIVNEKYTISDKLYEGHIRRKQQHIEKGNGFGFSVFNRESQYTNTLSARYYKDGSEILISQENGANPRKLTPKECARLQGFPPEFIIPVSDTQAYKQFGNSVAVPAVEAVAKSMLNFMEETGLI